MSCPAKPPRPAWYQIRPKFLLTLGCLAGMLFWYYRSINPAMGHGPAAPVALDLWRIS